MIEDLRQQLARSSASKTDDVLRSAILAHTREDEISLTDWATFGECKRFPDGTEIYSYEGVDLVKFWPVDIQVEGFKMAATRKYQLLR